MTAQLAGTVPVATAWQPNPHAVLQARGLVKEFPSHAGHPPKRVVDGVSLQVGPGRVHAVMGLSGAGKSTLVGMLAGLLEPTAGEIYHLGERAGTGRLRRVAAVSTGSDTGFYAHLSVRDNLVFFGALLGYDRRAARARADEVLELVGLRRQANAEWSALSSGQRRQGHLARALLTRRPLLIADEPTRGLDPATEQHIVDLLAGIKAAAQSMLLVTHDVHLASSMADWVSIMEGGQVIRSGAPQDLLHLLAAARIYIRFEDDPRRIVERLQALEHLTDIHTHDQEVHVYTTDPEHDINDVVRIVVEERAQISHIDLPEPSLEEVFLKVIAERKHQLQLARRRQRSAERRPRRTAGAGHGV